MAIDPLRYYRAKDLLEYGYSPYTESKNVLKWMLANGGFRITKRVVAISGAKLLEVATKNHDL